MSEAFLKLIFGPVLPAAMPRCGNCEFFDVGAVGPDGHSDCLNRLSARFQTFTADICPDWVRSST